MNWNNKAFTLVELIVVITILAVLGTIAFVSFNWYLSDAKQTTNKTNIRLIEKNLQIFYTKHALYPNPENSVNITSSGTVVAQQWQIWNRVLSQIWIWPNTVDLYTEKPFIYSISKKTNKYGLMAYQSAYTSNVIRGVYANSLIPSYHWNWSPIVVDANKVSVESDVDILNVNEEFSVYFDNEDYWENSEKLLKYYYHPNAISIVNFNDSFFKDILWNKTYVNWQPSITKWKVGNWMLVNGDWWWLKVLTDKFTLWEKLTISAWINQNEIITTEWSYNCSSNSIIVRHISRWAYMVSDHRWNICGYRYKFSPAWYHDSSYTNSINNWTHIAQVWNWVDLKFYINWVQQGASIPTVLSVGEDPNDVWGWYFIWVESFKENSLKRYFNWIIDEVSLYNTDLSAAEIKEIYEISQ